MPRSARDAPRRHPSSQRKSLPLPARAAQNFPAISLIRSWKSTQQLAIQNSGYAPPKEAAILAMLQPGHYTAIVRGNNNTTGVALVEVYNLDAN